LFERYWPEYDGTIFLNTETKDFEFSSLRIMVTKNGRISTGERPTWTEATKFGLSLCQLDTIVYLQEDYFLKGAVQNAVLADIVATFQAKKLAYLSLVDFAHQKPSLPTPFDQRFHYVSKEDPFRLSLQACVMSRKRMLPYFRRHENPWHFEIYGSKRSRRGNDVFCTVNPSLLGSEAGLLIPYDPTGIRERQWVRAVVEALFAKNNIEVDFTKRGWYNHDTIWDDEEPLSLGKLIRVLKSMIWGKEVMPQGRWPWQNRSV
jgi:hypothetical protein